MFASMFSSPSFLGCPGYGGHDIKNIFERDGNFVKIGLYAWEKKLYDEVKAGGSTQKIYKRKCSQLRNKDMRREVRLQGGRTGNDREGESGGEAGEDSQSLIDGVWKMGSSSAWSTYGKWVYCHCTGHE
ncbi:hypothetical protein CK203_116592 [Vitis vinifera]|uniref:DUF632 domain-containing protein n=1 Tax=Vitis vinifera TaxID=29760 RepID=A0A438FDZ8_VITVI|nr:hypothetical protein CK203_116592 [Vitis vinifera]